MKRVVTTIAIATCIAVTGSAAPPAWAQGALGVAVGFRNELKIPVIVQGYSIVRGMPKAGIAMVILPGRTASDNFVPAGVRFYRVCDANMPNLVYLRDVPVPVGGRDVVLAIRGTPPKITLEPINP